MVVRMANLLFVAVCLAGISGGTWAPNQGTHGSQKTRAHQGDARHYKVDGIHSSVVFKVQHLRVSWFYGLFTRVSGTFTLDAAHLAQSSVQIVIAADSLDSHNRRRDRDIMSQDFLAVKQFPTISFSSTKVELVDASHFRVTGKLTFRGKTKTLSVIAEHVGSGAASSRFGWRSGFQAVFTIKRSAFGMDAFLKQGMLGDEVTITASLEGFPVKQ